MTRTCRLDFDDNTSMWAHTAKPVARRPSLAGDVTADVAIIGAGFTGISTAYHLARRYPDRRIVVLEAKQVLAEGDSVAAEPLLSSIASTPLVEVLLAHTSAVAGLRVGNLGTARRAWNWTHHCTGRGHESRLRKKAG